MLVNPKFLHELVFDLYEDKHPMIQEHELQRALEDNVGHYVGDMWEKVLAKHMPHTTLLGRNAWHRDFSDGTDAKFASISKYTYTKFHKGTIQATVRHENKIGTLRVCVCFPGDKLHKVYFLLIPHDYYSTFAAPIKINFKNFSPFGETWDRFRCSFQQVISPINEPKVFSPTHTPILTDVPIVANMQHPLDINTI